MVGKADTGLKEMLALAAVAGRMGTALGVHVVAGNWDVGRTEPMETSAGCYNQLLMAASGACVRWVMIMAESLKLDHRDHWGLST